MAIPGGTEATQVSIQLDPQSVAILVQQITAAFERSFTTAAAAIKPLTGNIAREVAASIEAIQPVAKATAKELAKIGTAGTESFSAAEKHIIKLVDNMLAAEHATGIVIRELANLSIAERRAGINAGQAATDAARLQIAQVRNIGIQTNIEGQKAVVVARGAAKSRVLITQGMVRSIVLLEKGIGITIASVARTATSAVAKTFSGLAGIFKRDTGGIDAQLRQTNAAIARGVRQGNTEFTQGVRGSLSKREELLRSSFRTQETIVTRSALRQQEALAGLRRGTQTGVLGAANRGLNLGAILGGAAIFTAVRSTFSVGSDFVRGLAVLQSQLDLTGDQMKSVRQLAIDLGNDISLPGVSALDAAQAIQILTKQFGSLGPAAVDAAEKAAKGTLQLARAAGVGAEDAAGIIGSAVNVFGISADKAVTIADQVAGTLAKAAGVSFEDFKTSFVQGATVFNNFIGPAEDANSVLLDFNTTLAVLAKNGIVGETAGAGLKQFFLSASKQSDKAIATQKELAARAGQTGTVFFDAAGKARTYDDAIRILRKGLVGYTDQQKQATLTTLFGVRSQTIASAIIKTSQEDYDRLRGSIQQQGLAAKIAAAQNTGFAGALDALKSVLETAQILLFEKVNPALRTVTLGFATLFNNILSGTGAFAILRRGLLGVAAGMGAIIAAKGAVEVIKLLGTSLKFLLTPFGAVLAIAGLVGAAISILADRSEPFRVALGDLVDRLKILGGDALKAAGKGLAALGGVIERNVLPFLIGLVNFLSTHVVTAFDAVVRFITDKAIPALKDAGLFIGRIASIGFRAVVDFIRDHVLPALADFADFVVTTVVPVALRVGVIFANAFGTALDAVQRFWHWVEPVLKPMLDGFKELGGAIAAIFTGGDFSKLGSGFAAVGSGIASSFTGIGKNLLGVLDRLRDTLAGWFKTNFSGPKLINLGKGFLDLVEFIGHTLGAIVTSPTFVRAVATLAAGLAVAAALVAGRFIEGFGKALIDHLPGLFDLFTDALLSGLVAAINNPLIVIGIGLAIAAVLRVVSVIKAFSAAGQAAGGGFLGGLKGAFRKSTFAAQSGALQFRSIFDGDAFTKYAKQQGFNAGKAMVKEFGRNNALLRTANLPGLQPINPGFLITKKQSAEAAANVEKLRLKLGDVGFAALQARTNTQSLFAVFRGAKDAIGGIGAAFAVNRTAGEGFFKSLRLAFSGAIQAMKRTALLEGSGVGAALLAGIKGALTGAAAAVGGFIAGKAEGQGGGSGITSALLTGLTVGSFAGPEAGIIAGAATLIGAAFGRAEGKAKALREEISQLSKTFAEDLVKAIESGQIKLDGLKFPANFGISNILGDSEQFDQAVQDFAAKLKPEQIKAILNADVGGIRGIIDILKKSGNDVDRFSENFRKQFLDNAASSDQFRKRFGSNAGAVAKLLQGGNSALKKVLGLNLFKNTQTDFTRVVAANKDFLQTVLSTSAAVTDYAGDLTTAAQNALDLAAATAKIPPSPFTNLNAEHGTPTFNPFSSLIEGVKTYIPELKKAVAGGAALFLNLVNLGASAEDAQTALSKLGFPPIPQSIIDDWNKQLQSVQDKADRLHAVVDGLPGDFASAAAAAVNLPTTVTEAQAKITVTADTSSIADVITNIAGGITSPEGIVALNQLGTDVGNAVGTAIAQGVVVDPATLQTFLTNLQTAALAGVTNQSAIDAINTAFLNIFAGLAPKLPDGVGAVLGAQLQDQIVAFTKDHPFITPIAAEFQVSFKNNPALLFPGDFPDIGNPNARSTIAATSTLLDSLLPTQAEIAAAGKKAGEGMNAAGVQTAAGYAAGIHSRESLRLVQAAIKSLTDAAVKNANQNLKISSPSKVMMEVGGFVSQGLADGITAGASAAATAAATAAQGAVDAAKEVAKNNTLTFGVTVPTPTVPVATSPRSNIESGAFHDRQRAIDTGVLVAEFAKLGKILTTPAAVKDFGHRIGIAAHAGSLLPEANPRLSITSDRTDRSLGEGIFKKAIRDAISSGRAIGSAFHWSDTKTIPPLDPQQAIKLTTDWLNRLTPDLQAVLRGGINSGTINTSTDAKDALGVLRTQFLDGIGGFVNGELQGDALLDPARQAIAKVVAEHFDAVAQEAASQLATKDRLLGHGLTVERPVTKPEVTVGQLGLDKIVEVLGKIPHMPDEGDTNTVVARLADKVAPGEHSQAPKTLQASHEELNSLIALARGLVTAAEQLNKRGPDVTNVSIVEAKDARATARAAIAELRTDRMLLRGRR